MPTLESKALDTTTGNEICLIKSSAAFIPPDGEFDLMTYRVDTHVKPLIWADCVVENFTRSKIEYLVKAKT